MTDTATQSETKKFDRGPTIWVAAWLIIFAAILTGPSFAGDGNDGDAEAALPYPSGINCVWMPRPNGFTVIDSKHLVIEGTGRRSYLVTLYSRCFDLRTTHAIKLDRRGSDLCGPGDAIITQDDRCSIRYMEEVEDRAEARTIVADRKAAAKAVKEERDGTSQ